MVSELYMCIAKLIKHPVAYVMVSVLRRQSVHLATRIAWITSIAYYVHKRVIVEQISLQRVSRARSAQSAGRIAGLGDDPE
jgi:hypothetical protein